MNRYIYGLRKRPASIGSIPAKGIIEIKKDRKTCDYDCYIKRGELTRCKDCGIRTSCKYLPKPGAMTRINCPLWRGEQ